MLAQIRELTEAKESFCVETNLAGRGFVRWVDRWHRAGYSVQLEFIALRSADLAVARVARRVAMGGHDIPEPVIRRRWQQGLRSLFDDYLAIVDDWSVEDNSGREPVPVARGTRSGRPEVHDGPRWDLLHRLADSGTS
jgi:predicted ABC-type ATPase